MIFTECVNCDNTMVIGYECGDKTGFGIHQCEECSFNMWVEYTSIGGGTRTHKLFIEDIATPDGKAEQADSMMAEYVKEFGGVVDE